MFGPPNDQRRFMSYKAMRSMKVRGDDGQIRSVKPGDPVPEASGWKNLRAYLNRKWVCREDEPLDPRYVATKVDTEEPAKVSAEEPAQDEAEKSEEEGGLQIDETPTKYAKSDLLKMSKPELQVLADERGVNPAQNKEQLADDILAAQ